MWVNPLTYSISLLNSHAGSAECLPRSGGEPGRDGGFRAGAAAGLRHDGGAESHAQRGMSGQHVGQAILPAAAFQAARRLKPASACAPHLQVLVCLSLLLLLAGCVQVKPLAVLGQVPQFQLTSQTGQPFDSKSLDGHVWVADFIYTTCDGPCPMMSHADAPASRIPPAQLPDVKLVSLHRGPGARHAAGAGRICRPLQAGPRALVLPDRRMEQLNELGVNASS